MEEQNPWWSGEADDEYLKWKNSEIRWIPPILEKFDFKPFSLNFLVGPRQVGKTTALKIFINEYLLKKINPKAVFYYSCDELTDFRELSEVLDNYLSYRERFKIKSSFIILDEITFVNEWYRAIKYRIDRGKFERDVLIITGSASLELLQQRETFPGRRGYGKDIFFYPLSFQEFFDIFWSREVVRCESLLEIDKRMRVNSIFSESVSEAFSIYLKTGGFPLPIIDYFSKGRISNLTKKAYIDWIKSDLAKVGKSERYAKEVLAFILRARCAPVSWLSISKETSIASPHTAQSYVEMLERLFIIKILYFLSPKGRILYRKNKKIHIIDPFIYKCLAEYTRENIEESQILESVVAAHLSRKFPTYYWRNGSEVDLVVLENRKQIGIEVKTRAGPWRKPRHLDKVLILDKQNIGTFLISLDLKE